MGFFLFDWALELEITGEPSRELGLGSQIESPVVCGLGSHLRAQ